jgi:hypothetical protein
MNRRSLVTEWTRINEKRVLKAPIRSQHFQGKDQMATREGGGSE